MTARLTILAIHNLIGITPDTPGYGQVFGKRSKERLSAVLANPKACRVTEHDLEASAARLGVPVGHIKGVRKVEAPRGPFDKAGRPSILYERHVFARTTQPAGRFDKIAPDLSGPSFGPGGYGTYDSQFDKLAAACAYDPDAAFQACSWGAFQVLGENAVDLGYASAFDMAISMTTGEAAHVDSFVRFVIANDLVEKFRACRPGDAESCVPFVSGYNGPAFRRFNYHHMLAGAI